MTLSQEVFIRGLFSGIFAFTFAWVVFSRYDMEVGSESTVNDRQKYLPYIPGSLLPLFLFTFGILGTVVYGITGAAKSTLSMCFGIFMHISIYYAALILLLPFFRRHISARACAMLWMIPNYLYITTQSYMKLPSPLIIISAPGNVVWIIFFVWFAGFFVVLSLKTLEHFLFRRRILKDARPVSDPLVLNIWENSITEAKLKKPKFRLFLSPAVKTPLSIGLFRSKIRVVLPVQNYSPEELELILRHEIIHIAREDNWSKYFLVFCAAMCWFHPLMWIAVRKSAEDLELSCDETVLLNANENTRKKYALLLLNTAQNEHGFTTCLAASATSLRYRLKNITRSDKRPSGALIVGLMFFILCMTSGYIALSYGEKNGAELIYQHEDYQQYHLRHISKADDEYLTHYEVADEVAFHEYLSGLTLSELTGNYSFSDYEIRFHYLMDTPHGTLTVTLSDNIIQITPLYVKNPHSSFYYIEDGVDWDYIGTLLPAYPALNLHLIDKNHADTKDFSTLLNRVWKTADGKKSQIFDSGHPAFESYGLYGYSYDEAVFSFSKELSAPCSILIETWDRTDIFTVTQKDLTTPFTLFLPNIPAHYTVYASFEGPNGELYEAEFRFDIEE